MVAPLQVDETTLAVHILTDALDARVVTELPVDLETQIPLVRVLRIGGPDDGYALDIPTMAVHAFAADQITTDALCRDAIAALRTARGVPTLGAVITRIEKLSGPSWAAVDNQQLRHSVMLLQLRIKSA